MEHINREPNLKYLFRVPHQWITETKHLLLADIDTIISFEPRTTQHKEDRELFKQGKAKCIAGISKHDKDKKEVSRDFERLHRMNLRVVRFRITDTGNDYNDFETIVTSLNRVQFPIDKKLYHLRRGIETSFRELKYSIRLSNLHRKK